MIGWPDNGYLFLKKLPMYRNIYLCVDVCIRVECDAANPMLWEDDLSMIFKFIKVWDYDEWVCLYYYECILRGNVSSGAMLFQNVTALSDL